MDGIHVRRNQHCEPSMPKLILTWDLGIALQSVIKTSKLTQIGVFFQFGHQERAHVPIDFSEMESTYIFISALPHASRPLISLFLNVFLGKPSL